MAGCGQDACTGEKRGREAGGGRLVSQLGTCPLGSDAPLVPSSREALQGVETGEAVIAVYTMRTT